MSYVLEDTLRDASLAAFRANSSQLQIAGRFAVQDLFYLPVRDKSHSSCRLLSTRTD